MAGNIRRIQVVGGTTYTISLPRSWVIEAGLGKGSLVSLETLPDGSLLIKPVKEGVRERPAKNTVIEYRGEGFSRLLRTIISHYIAGARSMEIRYREEDYSTVKKVLEQLLEILFGVELLESEPGLFKLYSVLDDYAVGFWDAYRKMRRGVIGMLEGLIRGITEENRVLLEATVERDNLVDRLYLYLVRQMTRALLEGLAHQVLGVRSTAETPHTFLAIKSLERIGDHTVIIARLSLEDGGLDKIRPYLDDLRQVSECVHNATSLLEDPGTSTLDEAHRIADMSAAVRRRLRDEKTRERSLHATRALDSMERIASYAQDITEAVINIATIRGTVDTNIGPSS